MPNHWGLRIPIHLTVLLTEAMPIDVQGNKLKVPVLIQPGQAKGTVGLSFGYGKRMGLKEEMQTGVNAYSLYHNFKKHKHKNL